MSVRLRPVNLLRVMCVAFVSQRVRFIVERISKDYKEKRKVFFKKKNQCNSKLKKSKPHARRTKY